MPKLALTAGARVQQEGPVNFTMFLNLTGEKLIILVNKGTDPEETILNAFKLFDPEGNGFIHKDELQYALTTQADKFSAEGVRQMFQSSNIYKAGNLHYKSLCYVITHGEERDIFCPLRETIINKYLLHHFASSFS